MNQRDGTAAARAQPVASRSRHAPPFSSKLVTACSLFILLGAAVEVPFYAHGIHRAEWPVLLGSQLDWKSFPPFNGAPALQSIACGAFIILPFAAASLVVVALRGVGRVSIRERRVRLGAVVLVFLVLLPWVLHGRRLIIWYLD